MVHHLFLWTLSLLCWFYINPLQAESHFLYVTGEDATPPAQTGSPFVWVVSVNGKVFRRVSLSYGQACGGAADNLNYLYVTVNGNTSTSRSNLVRLDTTNRILPATLIGNFPGEGDFGGAYTASMAINNNLIYAAGSTEDGNAFLWINNLDGSSIKSTSFGSGSAFGVCVHRGSVYVVGQDNNNLAHLWITNLQGVQTNELVLPNATIAYAVQGNEDSIYIAGGQGVAYLWVTNLTGTLTKTTSLPGSGANAINCNGKSVFIGGQGLNSSIWTTDLTGTLTNTTVLPGNGIQVAAITHNNKSLFAVGMDGNDSAFLWIVNLSGTVTSTTMLSEHGLATQVLMIPTTAYARLRSAIQTSVPYKPLP